MKTPCVCSVTSVRIAVFPGRGFALSAGVFDVILLLRLSYGSGRDILHGFSTAVRREKLPWRLHVVNFEISRIAEDVRKIVETEVHGIVAHGLTQNLRDAIDPFHGPIVLIGNPITEPRLVGRKFPVAYVHADEASVARIGAAHLLSLGKMRCYGYVGHTPVSERATTFHAALESRRAEIRDLYSMRPGWADSDETLSRFLRDMPKPAAIMTESDNYALWVEERAVKSGIKVPKDMAVLGVDNDELLCESADPPLSSVAVDHERLGSLAVDAMRRLLSSRKRDNSWPFELCAPARRVVERQSARPVAPAAALAERAAAFIRRNATNGISSSDVAAQLGVSRTLADMRFRQVHGESMLAMILRLRLDAVKKKLAETSLPIGQICASCGFRTDSRAKHLFKERFGVSMRQWRASTRIGEKGTGAGD